MFFKSKKLLGLDIGSSSIKLAELDVGKKEAKLLNFGFAPTPPNSISGGEIVEPESLGEAIRSLVDRLQIKRGHVATGMWGTSVIVKKISMPPIDSALIAEQVKWEAEQYIPLGLDEINLQYHIISSGSSRDGIDVLLVAARQDFVFRYVETMVAADLTTNIVDVTGFALANCFEFNYGKRKSEIVALINIGATTTNFVIVEHGNVVFSRDISVGGMNYTLEINKDLGISLEEAEALKISAVQNQEVPQEVHSIISSVSESISEEIQHGFDFYGATAAEGSLSRIYFTGGGAFVPGLLEQISQTLSIPYELMDPFEKIAVDRNKFSLEHLERIRNYAPVAIGLALRKPE